MLARGAPAEWLFEAVTGSARWNGASSVVAVTDIIVANVQLAACSPVGLNLA